MQRVIVGAEQKYSQTLMRSAATVNNPGVSSEEEAQRDRGGTAAEREVRGF